MYDTPYSVVSAQLLIGDVTAPYHAAKDGLQTDAHWHCALEEEPDWEAFAEVHWVRLDDVDRLPLDAMVIRSAERAARQIAERIEEGATVLVTCMSGWNRSGLVAALALRNLGDPDPIGTLRDARCENVLCNRAFAMYVQETVRAIRDGRGGC